MSDLQLLFLVLVILYGWECACWLRRGSAGLRTWLRQRWRLVHPGTLLGNQFGGFVFMPPFPPLGNIVCGNQFPLSLSPHAVLAYVSSNVNPGWRPAQTGALFRFDRAQTIRLKGKKVLVDGQLLWKAPTSSFGQYLAGRLSDLYKAPVAQRGAMIQGLFQDSLDSAAIKQRWENFLKRTRTIRWLTNILFVYLFVAVPGLIWNLGLKSSWVSLLIGLFVLTGTIAFLFRRVHASLYPRCDDDRFAQSLTVFLSPVTAVRAQDILSRPLLEQFHPLALVQVFCSQDCFQRFAKKILLELRFPPLPVSPAGLDAEQTERFSRSALRIAAENFLTQNEINPDKLVSPPPRADATCQTYCPRCEAQFTTRDGICADCGGLPLALLPAAEAEISRPIG
jgi:hypothetical protein